GRGRDGRRQPHGDITYELLVAAFHHHPDHGFRTRSTQHDSAALAELAFGCRHRIPNDRRSTRVDLPRDPHVFEHLRVLRHRCGKLRETAPGLLHDREHLQCADERIPGRGAIETQEVARALTSKHTARLAQLLEHVAIAHFRTLKLDALLRERMLETQIAHDGSDDRADERFLFVPRARNDVEQLIAVDEPTEMIDHEESIAVAIQRDSHIRAHAGDRELQQLGRSGAAVQIDVAPVRRAADRNDLGPQIREDSRPDLIAGAMSAIDDDLEAGQIQSRHCRRAKLLVLHARFVDAHGAAELARAARERRLIEKSFDLTLDLVGEFAAVAIEEFDAVIPVEIVRGADDDAEVTFESLR